MSAIRDGGPAFPTDPNTHPGYYAHHGMSLRDHFAGQALPTVVGLIGLPEDEPDDLWNKSIAAQCYAIADAMIAEREKGGAS